MLEFAPLWLRPIIAIAVATGMRRSEILGLRWIDMDLEGGRVLLSQTKNGEEPHRLSQPAGGPGDRVVVRLRKNEATDFYFPISAGVGQRCLLPPVPQTQNRGFRFHDLRHTAASWLRMKGADIHTVAQLLGHKDLRMAARYQHLSPDIPGGCGQSAGCNFLGMSPVCHRSKVLSAAIDISI